jgi:hypothetical protein
MRVVRTTTNAAGPILGLAAVDMLSSDLIPPAFPSWLDGATTGCIRSSFSSDT